MNTPELSRISSCLVAAIADARKVGHLTGMSIEFRAVTRHAREMHERLVDALMEGEPLMIDYLAELAESTALAIEELEARAATVDGVH